jgi:hypothetical protein
MAREQRPGAARETGEQRRTAAGEGVSLRVLLQEAGSRKPVPSARMTVLVQTSADPWSVTTQEIWTDSSGVAESFLPQAFRIAVRSEYCTRPTEVALDGSSAEAVLPVIVRFPVSGRVVDPAGRPLAGAGVALAILREEQGQGAPAGLPLLAAAGGLEEFAKHHARDLAARCLTDADGRFQTELDILRPIAAAAGLDGFVAADWRGIPFSEEDRRYDPVTIVLHPAAELEVRFLSMKGAVIPGHAVGVRETARSEHRRRYFENVVIPFAASGTPGEDGSVRLRVPSGLELYVESRHGGEPALMYAMSAAGGREPDFLHDPSLESVRLEAGASLALVASPRRNVRLECAVRDGGGAPLAGAALLLPGKTVLTGADGRTSLLIPYNAALGIAYRVEKEGYRGIGGLLPAPAEETDRQILLEAVLEKANLLRIDAGEKAQGVWLIDAAGIRISGSVESGGESLVPEEFLVRGSGKDGAAWLFPDDGRKTVDILVRTGPFSFHVVREVPVEDGRAAVEVPLGKAGVVLKGRVVYPEGSSPQSVTVAVMRNDLPGVRRFDPLGVRGGGMGWTSGRVGPDGAFRFEDLAAGRYALTASLVEWGLRTDLYGEVEIDGGEDSISITLEPSRDTGSAGFLIIDEQGEPLTDADMLLLDPIDSPLAATPLMGTHFITASGGRIVIDDLPPGRYGFVVSGLELPGVPVSGRVLVEAGVRAEVVVRIDR